jgi:hypothetical protein
MYFCAHHMQPCAESSGLFFILLWTPLTRCCWPLLLLLLLLP